MCLGSVSEKDGHVFTSVLLSAGWFVRFSAGLCKKKNRTDFLKFGGRMGHEPKKNLVWTKGKIQDFLEDEWRKTRGKGN